MWIPDLGEYQANNGIALRNVVAVGWLDNEHPFRTGVIPVAVYQKLGRIVQLERVNVMRHLAYCMLCPPRTRFVMNGGEVPYFEVWIPSPDRQFAYASPNTILHFIEEHSYLPPEEYINTVMAFDLHSDWSGEAFRKVKIAEAYEKS